MEGHDRNGDRRMTDPTCPQEHHSFWWAQYHPRESDLRLRKKDRSRVTMRSIALCLSLLLVMLAGCTTPPISPDAVASTAQVDMKDLKYSPASLTIAVGTTVTWTNLDPFGHTVSPTDTTAWGTEGSGDATDQWLAQNDEWSFTFTDAGTYDYYCLPHASKDAETGQWRGMTGTVIVSASAATGGATNVAKAPPPARPVDVPEIGRAASDVPPPVGGRSAEHLYFDITAKEVVAQMADGTTYDYWTFDGTVPGPMFRGRVGDTITVNLTNDASSTVGHNIDFHAVNGPGGGAPALNAAPGATASATFKLLNEGLFVYHCAYQDPPLHVAHGMYGQILVEPAAGLPPVDREYYVMQGDFYSPFSASDKGHHAYDGDRAASEDATFVVFNGRMGSLQDTERQLLANTGETVRMFVGNGGPNLVSSYHVIGEIFDRVWEYGGLGSAPHENVQTALVPAGGSAIVEFKVEVPGDYYLVDHSIFRVHKGAFGVLRVTGDEDPSVYREGQ